MELGDRYLVVQRASLGASARRDGQLTGANSMDFPPQPLTTAPSILAASAGEGQPTKVLQILNMVAPEELVGDEDYKEIMEDIKEECEKFGKVEEVKIPRPVATDKGKVDVKASEAVKDLGKVFVLFEKEEETTKALRAIAGRQFGGEFRLLLLPLCDRRTIADILATLDVLLQDASASAPTPRSRTSSSNRQYRRR